MDESNFVVKTIFHARGNSEVLTENYFATRKEAEEFCALTDYAMKLNYGAEQQLRPPRGCRGRPPGRPGWQFL